MELPPVSLKPLTHLLHVWLALGFEIHDFNRVSLAANQVNFTFDDVVRLYQRYIDLGLLYLRPVTVLSVYIAKYLLQSCFTLRTSEVGMLGFRQRYIVGVKPTANILLRDGLFLMPDCGTVYIFDSLMD